MGATTDIPRVELKQKWGVQLIGGSRRGRKGGERWRNALDFGLQALLFLGRALDGARVLCVRLESRTRMRAEKEEKVKGERARTAVTDS